MFQHLVQSKCISYCQCHTHYLQVFVKHMVRQLTIFRHVNVHQSRAPTLMCICFNTVYLYVAAIFMETDTVHHHSLLKGPYYKAPNCKHPMFYTRVYFVWETMIAVTGEHLPYWSICIGHATTAG